MRCKHIDYLTTMNTVQTLFVLAALLTVFFIGRVRPAIESIDLDEKKLSDDDLLRTGNGPVIPMNYTGEPAVPSDTKALPSPYVTPPVPQGYPQVPQQSYAMPETPSYGQLQPPQSQPNYGSSPPQPNYGSSPPQQNYGPPQQQSYGPPSQQYDGPPAQQPNYGSSPPQQNYGPPLQQPNYGQSPPQYNYGQPPPQQSYQPQQPNYGQPPMSNYGPTSVQSYGPPKMYDPFNSYSSSRNDDDGDMFFGNPGSGYNYGSSPYRGGYRQHSTVTVNSPVITALGNTRGCELLYYTLLYISHLIFPIHVQGGISFLCAFQYAQDPVLRTDTDKINFVRQSIIPQGVTQIVLCQGRATDLRRNPVDATFQNGECTVRGGIHQVSIVLANAGYAHVFLGLNVLAYVDIVSGALIALQLSGGSQLGNVNNNNERCLINALRPLERTLNSLGGCTCTFFLPRDQDLCQLFSQGNIDHFIVTDCLYPRDLQRTTSTTTLSRTQVDVQRSPGGIISLFFVLGIMNVDLFNYLAGLPCIIYHGVELIRGGRPTLPGSGSGSSPGLGTPGGQTPVGRTYGTLINVEALKNNQNSDLKIL